MADILLDGDGDLDLTAGEMTLVRGADAIAQHIKIALRLFKGEWFRAPADGIPYFDNVFVKGVRPASLDTIFRKALLKVPGVLDVLTLTPSIDAATRTLTLDFEVRVEDSEQPLVFTDFVIE